MTSSAFRAPRTVHRARVAHLASIVFLGMLPALAIATLFATAVADDTVAMDFRQFYAAAHAILDGESPYLRGAESLTAWGGPYPYPPLPAILTTPLAVLPLDVAGLGVMVALVLAVLAVLWVLGVRDWRCYGVILLWPPVISAVQTGNVTLWFALALALAWRYRERAGVSSASIGITLAAKFFLWPLVVWFAATKRYASAGLSVGIGAVLVLASWAVIGFSGLGTYPDLLQRLEEVVGEDSYTTYIVGLDLGLSSSAARFLWLLLGLGLLGAVVVFARRKDERAAYVVAIAASLALTPIVWLHYFALLVVVVAIAQPRLGVVWFVPLAMVVTPGSGHPTPFETAWTLTVAALTIALAVRACRRSREPNVSRVSLASRRIAT